MESVIGSALGGFTLTRPLGSGPTGETFAALDRTSSPAALKLIHPALSLFTRAEAFRSELRRIYELSHPHIAVASAADWSKAGRFFLSLDLLEGVSLDDALKRHGRLPAAQALLLVGQVCLALEAVHELGLPHGALKPRNIFLLPYGGDPSGVSTRVLDFATGCLLGAAPLPGTAGSPGVPEPAYLAPEQFGGPATPASDIYGLGVILFEAISGRRPFVGGYAELAAAHVREPLQIPSSIPAGLDAVLRRALAKAPTDRFADVSVFREALESWAASSPPALDEPALALFLKEGDDTGVGQLEGDKTVKVSFDELSDSVSQPEPAAQPAELLRAIAATINKGQSMPDVKKTKVPEDRELAAIAEKAATPLRSKPESAAAAVASTAPQPAPAPRPVESYLDEDEDLVELPLEKSVRAFVSNLLPVAPPPRKAARGGGNGESLETALEQFVQEAKRVNESLPPPVVDDRRLAELVRAPAIEEPKAPAPAAAPVLAAPLIAAPVPQPKRGGMVVPLLLSFVLGGGIVFGVYKLFLEKASAGDGSGAAPSTTAGTGSEGPATAAAGTGSGGSAAQPGSAAPAVKPDGTTGQAATAAATTPDGAGAKPDTAAAGASAKPDAAPSAAVEPPRPPKKAAKKVGRKPIKKEGVTVGPKHTPKPKKVEEKKDKKEKKGKKGGGSDWVDPFSQ